MIIDNTLVFSDSQAVTATARSTNIVDIGAAGTPTGMTNAVRRDIGIATEIPILVTVTEAFNNLTSLTFQLEVDDDPAFGSPRVVAVGAAVPLASLTLGAKIQFPAELPEGTNERFLGLRYTVAGAAPTLGKVFASITAGNQTN
jgi:hypothetical protein